jgi:hypothetical protein
MSSSLPNIYSCHDWNAYAFPNDHNDDDFSYDANNNIPAGKKAHLMDYYTTILMTAR